MKLAEEFARKHGRQLVSPRQTLQHKATSYLGVLKKTVRFNCKMKGVEISRRNGREVHGREICLPCIKECHGGEIQVLEG
jgi:hypothetical protein